MSQDKFNRCKNYGNMPKPPCGKDCPDRKAACSANCEKWAQYVKKRNAAYAERLKNSERMAGTDAYLRGSAKKPYLKKKDPGMH